jgi:hypothetical protein
VLTPPPPKSPFVLAHLPAPIRSSATWPCLTRTRVLMELGLLWLILAYGLSTSSTGNLPWHAIPVTLLPWFFLRWPFPGRAAIRSPFFACLHWGQTNIGGLALSFAATSVVYSLRLINLVPLAVHCLILLASFNCPFIPDRTSQTISNEDHQNHRELPHHPSATRATKP